MEHAALFRELFGNVLTGELLAEIEAGSLLMNLDSGETLLKAGKPVMGVPLMLSGAIRVSSVNEEGQELLLYYVQRGHTCPMSLTCFMTSQLSSVNATVEEASVCRVLPGPLVETLFLKHAAWKKFVMQTILDGLTEMIRSMDEIAFKRMDERLTGYLRQKSAITGSALIRLSHQQIADELGTHRVVISRLLKKLETQKKLLLYRSEIRLLGSW